MQVLVVLALGGGMGRTTVVLELGRLLAQRGRVLLVDLAPQGWLTKLLEGGLGVDQPSVLEVLTGVVSPEAALREVGANLWLWGADWGLGLHIEQLPRQQREGLLRHKLELIMNRFEFVIIDTMAIKNTLTVMATTGADRVLIPVEVTPKGVDVLRETIGFIQELREAGLPVGELLGVLPMREAWVGQRQPRAGKEFLQQMDALEIYRFTSLRDSQGVNLGGRLPEPLLGPLREVITKLLGVEHG